MDINNDVIFVVLVWYFFGCSIVYVDNVFGEWKLKDFFYYDIMGLSNLIILKLMYWFELDWWMIF